MTYQDDRQYQDFTSRVLGTFVTIASIACAAIGLFYMLNDTGVIRVKLRSVVEQRTLKRELTAEWNSLVVQPPVGGRTPVTAIDTEGVEDNAATSGGNIEPTAQRCSPRPRGSRFAQFA